MGDRALVTGGAGFVGLHLTRSLLEDGCDVVIVDDLSRTGIDPLLAELGKHAQVVQHDLRFPLPTTLGDDFRTVYHLAAMVGVARVAAEPDRVLMVNLLSTVNVIEWCARIGPETVFLSSTSEIGDGAVTTSLASLPVPESAPAVFPSPFLPRTAYAVSKLASELLLAHAAPTFGFRARIARYHNVYGPRMGHHHVIPELIGRAVGGENPLVVYGAAQRRAFCHISDAVRATRLLADHPADEPIVANVGNDQETVIGDLARLLLDRLGLDVDLDEQPAPAGSPDRRSPDLAVLRSRTGYEPKVPLGEGLDECIAWYTDEPGARRCAS
jgi:UDP-glucose 4-epimerase/UDP-glucuronate decarboxylase